jgi:glycosyltransferase involved in cell wall biosynthesis
MVELAANRDGSMSSVVIPTHESERDLVHTLAALVSGALHELVREVIVTDAGSQDDTAKVADVAGCRFMVQPGGLRGARLAAAAVTARADWLWFVLPGSVPEPGWIEETQRFIRMQEGDTANAQAAVLRRRSVAGGGWREAFRLAAAALGAPPEPQQGLLIHKSLYRSLGGHDPASAEPEAALLRRLGRRRIEVLGAAMVWRGP